MERIEEPIDLRLLHTFLEVARQGSVSRAAVMLGRSQPAISHRLRALEDDLGLKLFEKVGRRLKLTEHGHRLEAECRDLMALSAGLRERLTGDERVVGRVTIGTLPTLSSHLLVPAIAELLEVHADLELAFHFDFITELWEHLRTGRVDVVVAIGARPPDDLEHTVLGAARLVAVMAPRLAGGSGPRCSVEALRQLRYLAWDGPQDETFERVTRFVDDHGLARPQTSRIPHIETLRELAATGLGYAILPDYTVRRDADAGRLVAREIDGLDVAVRVTLVGRRGQVMAPALSAVRQRLEGLGF